MTLSIIQNSEPISNRVRSYYINKDPNLTHIYTSFCRNAESMDLMILEVYITKDHKISFLQPESLKFEDIIARIDEEIDLCKLLGIKDG